MKMFRRLKSKDIQFVICVLSAIVALLFFSGCVLTDNQKKRFLENNCQGNDSVRTVIKIEKVRHDSTVYITNPGPIQYLENPCKLLCDSLGNLKPFKPFTKKENGSRGTVSKVGNSISFKCDIDSAAVAFSWNDTHTWKDEFSHTESTIKEDCELEHRTDFDVIKSWWFWITACYYSLKLLLKFGKTYFRSYLPFLK
jgi:hypothetical protein